MTVIRKTYLMQIATAATFLFALALCFVADSRLVIAVNIVTMAATGYLFMFQFRIRDIVNGLKNRRGKR